MKIAAYEVISRDGFRNLYFKVNHDQCAQDGDQVNALVKRDDVPRAVEVKKLKLIPPTVSDVRTAACKAGLAPYEGWLDELCQFTAQLLANARYEE